MSKNSKTSFIQLNKDDTFAFFTYCQEDSTQLTLWSKGNDNKKIFNTVGFYRPGRQLLLIPEEHIDPDKLHDQSFLMNCRLRGVEYFALLTLEYSKNDKKYTATFPKDVFKCERRTIFRLPLLDYSEAQLDLNLNGESKIYKPLDISVSGISFIIPTSDKNSFKLGQELDNIKIAFENKTYLIPKTKVVYIIDLPYKKLTAYGSLKVAVKYIKLPEKLDLLISRHINQHLRDTDIRKSFEKYLK